MVVEIPSAPDKAGEGMGKIGQAMSDKGGQGWVQEGGDCGECSSQRRKKKREEKQRLLFRHPQRLPHRLRCHQLLAPPNHPNDAPCLLQKVDSRVAPFARANGETKNSNSQRQPPDQRKRGRALEGKGREKSLALPKNPHHICRL